MLNPRFDSAQYLHLKMLLIFQKRTNNINGNAPNGTRKLNGTKYPLYFAKAFLSLIDTIESNNGNFPFYTMSATLISGISNNLLIILMAILSTFIMIIPYAENEMRSGVIAFDYSSKTGRKMYVYKLASVFISVSIVIGASVLIAVFMFKGWEIQRYYPCVIDSVMFQEKSIPYPDFIHKCYSGISLLGLYGGLILFLFVCGVLLSVLIFIVSNKFNNIISAITACLPLFVMPVLLFYRYVSYALDTSGGVLIFRGEPILAMVILCTILLFIVTTVYKKQTKADI